MNYDTSVGLRFSSCHFFFNNPRSLSETSNRVFLFLADLFFWCRFFVNRIVRALPGAANYGSTPPSHGMDPEIQSDRSAKDFKSKSSAPLFQVLRCEQVSRFRPTPFAPSHLPRPFDSFHPDASTRQFRHRNSDKFSRLVFKKFFVDSTARFSESQFPSQAPLASFVNSHLPIIRHFCGVGKRTHGP